MKRVVVLGSAVVLGAVALVAPDPRGEDPCPSTYEFDGRTYVAHETTAEVTPRDALGSGTETGCGDGGPYTSEMAMHDVDGVDPRVAVVSPVNARAIYLARGAEVSDLTPEVAAVVLP
ncbi:hypothetical protein FE634_21660 [Nocardioides dongxiaopingii]|uniref:DUF6281 family protein n=1 Tax=Nocardioides sp. S-1144 TaxID=2582905 RepID=UPI001161ECCE|nr:DUF6281 family protein [Nocardioides sp. S-1144]QDH10825.1 hypothetical protein FE634_21660 [Nocardioides sp. S-1144]